MATLNVATIVLVGFFTSLLCVVLMYRYYSIGALLTMNKSQQVLDTFNELQHETLFHEICEIFYHTDPLNIMPLFNYASYEEDGVDPERVEDAIIQLESAYDISAYELSENIKHFYSALDVQRMISEQFPEDFYVDGEQWFIAKDSPVCKNVSKEIWLKLLEIEKQNNKE